MKRNFQTFPDPNSRKYEFTTISTLRKKIIKYDFLSPYNFSDIPIGILAVISGTELPAIPLSIFPKWSRKLIESTKANSLRMPANDCAGSLTKFVQIILNKRYELITQSMQASYDKNWNGLRQSLFNMLDTFGGESQRITDLKYYADLKLHQKQYQAAANAYTLLINNMPAIVNSIATEAQFMLSICDILKGAAGAQTLQSLLTSMSLSRSYIHITKCALVEFYIRATTGQTPSVALTPFVKEPSSQLAKFLAPFAKEQIAHLMRPRHAAAKFASTAQEFRELGLTYYTHLDLIAAVTPLLNEHWDWLMQSILEQAMETGHIPDDVKIALASCKTVSNPSVFEQFLKSGRYKCGFISAKMCSFFSEGYPCTEPLEFDGDWVETAERLFGAYRPGTFFNASFLQHKECLVGEQVDIRTLLMSDRGDIQMTKMRLKLSGDAKADVISATIARSTMADVNLSFIPTQAGTLVVEGVEFCWGSTLVEFYCDFKKPLVFTVYDKSPKLKIEMIDKKMTFFEGEICQFTFTLTNSDFPLTHVLFYTCGLPVKLIEPQIEEVCQMYPVGAMEKNEVKNFKISLLAKSVGFTHTHLLISYWNRESGPARYVHVDLMCNVKKLPQIDITRTDSFLKIKTPADIESIGFTHPYSDPDPYTTKGENEMTFKLVSSESQHKTILPDFIEPFFVNDTMRYWFSTKFGVCSIPIAQYVHPLRVLVSRIGFGKYKLRLKNAGKETINDVKIIVIEQDNPISYVLSGKSIVVIDSLFAGKDAEVELNFVLFQKQVYANVLISYELFCVSQKILIE